MRVCLLPLFFTFLSLTVDARSKHSHRKRTQPTTVDVLQPNVTKTVDERGIGLGLGTCLRVGAGGKVGSLLGTKVNVAAGACVCIDAAVDNLFVAARIEASGGADLGVSIAGLPTTLLSIAALGIVDLCLQADLAVSIPPLISLGDPHSTHAFPPSGSCCRRACITGYHEENGVCVPNPPTCNPGDVLCGNQCICAKDKVCVSGVPQSRKQRRNFLCPTGQVKCPVRGAGFECVNTHADIESCGGCMFDTLNSTVRSGADCTAIPNIDEVACIAGRCQVQSCQRGYEPSINGGDCVPRTPALVSHKKVESVVSQEFSIQGGGL